MSVKDSVLPSRAMAFWGLAAVLLLAAGSPPVQAQNDVPVGTESFSIPNLGGWSITSSGTESDHAWRAMDESVRTRVRPRLPESPSFNSGYSPKAGRSFPKRGSRHPRLSRTGRIFAESSGTPGQAGSIHTGLAIANPNDAPATIDFYFTDTDGARFAEGAYVLDAGRQIADFLNDDAVQRWRQAIGHLHVHLIAAHRRHRFTGIHQPGRRVPDDHAPGRAPGHPADAVQHGHGQYGYGLFPPFRRWQTDGRLRSFW